MNLLTYCIELHEVHEDINKAIEQSKEIPEKHHEQVRDLLETMYN